MLDVTGTLAGFFSILIYGAYAPAIKKHILKW
jgi:hypothetical protein